MRHARPKERLPVRLPDGAAQERCESPHVGEHTAIRRRQDVRHGEDAEDERPREQPDKRRGPGTCRTEGHGARVPRLHGQHDAGTAEEMAESRRDNQADKFPFKKTYRPALLIENKKLIKIVGFIGNDLETSVLLFSVSFCIIDKNAFCIANIRFIFGLQFVT